jgi:hypothetical protein
MPMTRHLYEMDEVVSAIQVCVRNGWAMRAVFWIYELVVSEELDLAYSTLRTAWLYWGGGHDPFVFENTSYTDADFPWVLCTCRVLQACKDAGSLNAQRLLNETAVMAYRPHMTPLATNENQQAHRMEYSETFFQSVSKEEQKDAPFFWISLDSACRQGRYKDACWILQAAQTRFSSESLWKAIRMMARGTQDVAKALTLLYAQEKDESLLFQTNAILLLCSRDEDRNTMIQKNSLSISFYCSEWEKWKTIQNRRSARMYSIPNEALHIGTTRGQMETKYTNIGDVREPVPLLQEGCAWWKRILKEEGCEEDEETDTILFPDEDAYELFLQRYFKDDLPDEWSLKDQQKSHGRGTADLRYLPPNILPQQTISQKEWNIGIHVPKRRKNAVQK